VIGILLGAEGLDDLNGFFIAPFAGVLAFFLLDMGAIAFSRIGALRQAGPQLIVFALVMPLISGSIGTIVGTTLGMQVGDVALLATLAASASYIAAPAAMRVAVPEANPGISLPLVLAVTFPLNLILGIPLYLEMARMLGG